MPKRPGSAQGGWGSWDGYLDTPDAGADTSGYVALTIRTTTALSNTNSHILRVDNDTTPLFRIGHEAVNGPVFRFGEATLFAAGADSAPYRILSSGGESNAMMWIRAHLEDGAANEQYNISIRTNFRGDATEPQLGVINECQWKGVDSETLTTMYGLQSTARIAVTTLGGTQAASTLMAGIRGDFKADASAYGTLTDGTGVLASGPTVVASPFNGTITRGSAVLARTGSIATNNYALQIEQGGGIVALNSLNSGSKGHTLGTTAPGTSDVLHNEFGTEFDGNVNKTSFAFRYFNLEPRLNWNLATGASFGNVMTTLHLSPTLTAAITLPILTGARINVRNTSTGTLTSAYGIDFTAPTNSGGGTITRFSHIRLAAPSAATNDFHMSLTPLQTTTPATTLNALTASTGDWIFVQDTNEATGSGRNTGPAFYDGEQWIHITAGGVAVVSDS